LALTETALGIGDNSGGMETGCRGRAPRARLR